MDETLGAHLESYSRGAMTAIELRRRLGGKSCRVPIRRRETPFERWSRTSRQDPAHGSRPGPSPKGERAIERTVGRTQM